MGLRLYANDAMGSLKKTERGISAVLELIVIHKPLAWGEPAQRLKSWAMLAKPARGRLGTGQSAQADFVWVASDFSRQATLF